MCAERPRRAVGSWGGPMSSPGSPGAGRLSSFAAKRESANCLAERRDKRCHRPEYLPAPRPTRRRGTRPAGPGDGGQISRARDRHDRGGVRSLAAGGRTLLRGLTAAMLSVQRQPATTCSGGPVLSAGEQQSLVIYRWTPEGDRQQESLDRLLGLFERFSPREGFIEAPALQALGCTAVLSYLPKPGPSAASSQPVGVRLCHAPVSRLRWDRRGWLER